MKVTFKEYICEHAKHLSEILDDDDIGHIWAEIEGLDLSVPEPSEKEQKTFVGNLREKKVFVANDNWVKLTYCNDYTEGSNGMACNDAYDSDSIKEKDWIPKDEIWLSGAIETKARPFILLHEYTETQYMEAGLGYEDAHDAADEAEDEYRAKFLGESRFVSFHAFIGEQFPGMSKEVEAYYHRKNRNGRKKGGIMPKPPVRKMKGIAARATGKRGDSFFY